MAIIQPEGNSDQKNSHSLWHCPVPRELIASLQHLTQA